MVPVLERITYYRLQKGWTEYQMAEVSGLTQSTISSWYRKNILPTIPSLEKLCTAFGITLSQFFAFDEKTVTLTPVQKSLLDEASRLTETQQLALVEDGFLLHAFHAETKPIAEAAHKSGFFSNFCRSAQLVDL